MVKPRMAHYNSYNLLDVDNPTWITVVILELIHAAKLRPYGTSAFIRSKPIGFGRLLLTLNNSADRMVLHRRRVFQVSALSTFDGSLCAYHGCNG
jgi:hypothetical protein